MVSILVLLSLALVGIRIPNPYTGNLMSEISDCELHLQYPTAVRQIVTTHYSDYSNGHGFEAHCMVALKHVIRTIETRTQVMEMSCY